MATDALNIYPNQCAAGEEILAHFDVGNRHVLLIAEMQAGKTGTAKYVAHQLITTRQLPARQIYFICGMNDNDLLNQAQREFAAILPKANILFSKQLAGWQAITGESFNPNTPIAVIVDESHYASNEQSLVDQFMSQVHPDTLILSVSATPMAELASGQAHGLSQVTLQPGPGYYGLRDLMASGLLYDSVDLTHFQPQFIDVVAEEIEEQQGQNEFRYNIVRLPNQWYYQDLEEELQALNLNLAFINHHSQLAEEQETDFNSYLKTAPTQSTIIWIYGGLRAGKQLNTEHLGFVHDTARSNPDTIAQSLLGRILGYGKGAHRVKCFTDRAAAQLMLNWIQSGFMPSAIPAGSRGILRGYRGVAELWTLHVPLAVRLAPHLTAYYRALKIKHGNRYPFREELFTDLLLSATTDRVVLQRILATYAPGKCGGLMILSEANVPRSYQENWLTPYAKYERGESTGTFLTAAGAYPGHYYVFLDLHRHSRTYGTALVIYKEGGDLSPPAVPAAPVVVGDKSSPVKEKSSPVKEKSSPVKEKSSPVKEKSSPVKEKFEGGVDGGTDVNSTTTTAKSPNILPVGGLGGDESPPVKAISRFYRKILATPSP